MYAYICRSLYNHVRFLPKDINNLLLQDILISYFKRHETVYFAISLQEINYFTNNLMELLYQIRQRFLYISNTYRKVINCIIFFFINNFHKHSNLYNDKFCRMYILHLEIIVADLIRQSENEPF